MRLKPIALALLAIAVTLVYALEVLAGECCCAHCGCGGCHKVCRLVCEDKKVDVICWGTLCEDFCLPKHNKPDCEHCKMVCAECSKPPEPGAPYVKPKRFVWTRWIPGCATMHTRTRLYKKVETVKTPSFKWVVEDLCADCQAKCEVAAIGPEDDVPAPPQVADAQLLYGLK